MVKPSTVNRVYIGSKPISPAKNFDLKLMLRDQFRFNVVHQLISDFYSQIDVQKILNKQKVAIDFRLQILDFAQAIEQEAHLTILNKTRNK